MSHWQWHHGLNSLSVLVASARAEAADPGAAAEQERPDRMDGAGGRAASEHRELPRLCRRSPQDDCQGF